MLLPVQIQCVCNCNGHGVLTSTNISNDDRKKFDKVVDKIDEYFMVRKNIIFERARFNLRVQQEGEVADEHITCLYSLADNCQYGNLKEEMIRDRLVVGIRDSALSERFQMDSELTLEKANSSFDSAKQSRSSK